MGTWAGISQAQISRIENGPPIVHLDRLIEWARLLGMPAECLWFKLPEGGEIPDETDDVRRRSFLSTAGLGLAGALSGDLGRPADGPGPQLLSDAVADLKAVMLSPPKAARDEPLTVAELTKQVGTAWQLRQRADYTGLSCLLPRLLSQVHARSTALDGDALDQASRVAAHAYNAASSLLKRLGDSPLALVAADRAVQSARLLGDPVLVAAAQYRLANVLLTARRADEARAVSLQAAGLIEPGKVQTTRSLAMWGSLLVTAAVAAAQRQDESGAWELMGEAKTASRLLGTDHADLYTIFGPTNVAIYGVQIAVELRNGRDAVRRGQRVNPDRLPPSLLERRSQFLIDVAHAHVLDGNDASAVATLTRAQRIAPQELRLNHDVHDLTHRMLSRERAGAATGLRDLAHSLGLTR